MSLVLYDNDWDRVELFGNSSFDSVDECMEEIKRSTLHESDGPTVEYMPWTLQDEENEEVHATFNKIYLSVDADIRGK
jgi:hypothetical protein